MNYNDVVNNSKQHIIIGGYVIALNSYEIVTAYKLGSDDSVTKHAYTNVSNVIGSSGIDWHRAYSFLIK